MTEPSVVTGTHLVGSINFDNAETTMRTAAEHIGERFHRIPLGVQRRIAAAKRLRRRNFGVAAERGFGRAPEGTMIPLFDTHRAVRGAW